MTILPELHFLCSVYFSFYTFYKLTQCAGNLYRSGCTVKLHLHCTCHAACLMKL